MFLSEEEVFELEEDEEDDEQIPSDEDLKVVARYKTKKRWPKSEVIFFKIPDSSVKENWPSDSPNYHAVNTKRFYNVNALSKKPYYKNHGH